MRLQRIFIKSIGDWSRKRPLSIVGATGSGKSSTIINFVRQEPALNPLLVSLDSVAAYQELDIGSSKPLGADFTDFDWAGVSVASPTETMNVALLKKYIQDPLQSAISSQRPIVFVGGTHFYERFIVEGAAPGTASDSEFLLACQARGKELVRAELAQRDSRWGDYLHANDEYRIFRYADLVLRQGLGYDELRTASQNPLFPEIECLLMDSRKEVLEGKLEARVREMLATGWIEETRSLIAKYGAQTPALRSIGYAEIVKALTESINFNQDSLAFEILVRHRQLAKQQRTWLRKLLNQSL